MTSLHGGSLEITLTLPLSVRFVGIPFALNSGISKVNYFNVVRSLRYRNIANRGAELISVQYEDRVGLVRI